MKKLFSSFSALIISCLMAVNVLAADLKIDNINVNSDNITFSVVLSELPNGLNAIHGLTFRYTYDASVLEYKNCVSTLLNKGGLEINVNDGKGAVVWLDMNVADETNSNKVTAEMLDEANGILLEFEFKKIDSAAEETSIIIDYARIVESIGNGEFSAATMDDMTIADGVIKFASSEGDNTGDDTTGEGETGSSNYEPILVFPEETYDDARIKVIVITNLPENKLVSLGGKVAAMLAKPDGSANYYITIDKELDLDFNSDELGYEDIVIDEPENEEAITKLIMGDADLNGEVTVEDVLIILKKTAELEEVAKYYENPLAYITSDIIGDGHITSSDAFINLGIVGDNTDAYRWVNPIGLK